MSSSEKPLVEFFIKSAPTDKTEKSACMVGQQWFMTLYGLVEQGLIDLRLTPMTLDQPPKNYTNLNAARHLPIAWIVSGKINGESVAGFIMSSSEALQHLMEWLNYPNLDPTITNNEIITTEEVYSYLYTKFLIFLRNNLIKPLLKILCDLDELLALKGTPYMLGNKMCYADCQLMPKLQHIRVAGQYYKQFDIPQEMFYLWRYIDQMYQTKAFLCSCPLDRDILMHYATKFSLPSNCRFHLMGPERLLQLPSYIISQKNVKRKSN